MEELIYLDAVVIYKHDPDIVSNPTLNKWKQLSDVMFGGAFVRPRVGPTAAPCKLANPICPMPTDLIGTDDFSTAMDTVMSRLVSLFSNNTREIYLYWSGGIDSTSILVGLLKNATLDVLSRTTVVCNRASIIENPYFYYTFVDGKIRTKCPTEVTLSNFNVDKCYIIDGEGGNQCFGSYWAAVLRNLNRANEVCLPWRSVTDFSRYMPTVEPSLVKNWVKVVADTIPYSPVPINTIHDFFWWANFNTKFEEVLFRKLIVYTEFLSAADTKIAATGTIIRPYAEPEMQIWSLLSIDSRLQTFSLLPKYQAKHYIFSYDKNHHYLQNKLEQASLWFPASIAHESATIPIFAIDKNWNKYHLGDPAARATLGKFLENHNGSN